MIYKGDKIEFELGKEIGKGGNGNVYDVLVNNEIKGDFVAKFFRYDDYGSKINRERYKRFTNEIKAVQDISKEIDGLLDIVDCFYPEEYNKSNAAWYVMRKAIPLSLYIKDKNVIARIKIMKEVAIILARIHQKGYAHRDVKPGNLLVLDDKVKLGDFGLVWHIDFDGRTRRHEHIGPWNTMAPEMRIRASRIKDPIPADVYSFAKTIGIVITSKEDWCLDVEYNRYGKYRLDHKPLNINTLEDVYCLLEQATLNNPSDRPTMLACIEMLDSWLKNNDDPILYKLQNVIAIDNKIAKYYPGCESIYRDLNKIIGIMSEIEGERIAKSAELDAIDVIKCSYSSIKECIEIFNGRFTYILRPDQLTLTHSKNPAEYNLLNLNVDKDVIPIAEKDKYIYYNELTPMQIIGLQFSAKKKKIILSAGEISFVPK